MPELSLETQGLASMTPGELEQRRRTIIEEIKTKYAADYDSAPMDLLRDLAAITSTLRRRNAGPPKAEKKVALPKGKKTVDNLLDML